MSAADERPGTVFVDYRIKLPSTTPIVLSFANAIRDVTPPEPPSDGVTFRVLVDGQVVFDRHTDSRVWVDGHADLSSLAGKEIQDLYSWEKGFQREVTPERPRIRASRPGVASTY